MSVLVATASRHGSTHEIGRIIAKAIREADISCEHKTVDSVGRLDGYQAVVLGSAVYAGSWLQPARRFVKRFVADLEKIPVWMFSSGPLGDPLEPSDHEIDPAILGAVDTVGTAVFAGRLEFDQLSAFEKVMVKAVKAPEGDFRNIHEIIDWADEISIKLFRPENATLLDQIAGT